MNKQHEIVSDERGIGWIVREVGADKALFRSTSRLYCEDVQKTLNEGGPLPRVTF
jgi:hypothetical protein